MTRTLGVLALAVAVLAACGGDDDGTQATGPTGSGQGVDVTVRMTEFAYDPATVEATPGDEVTVTGQNTGSIEHDWVALDLGREITAETDLPDDVDQVRTEWAVAGLHAQPGASETVTFAAPAPGTYQVVCLVPGHFSAGMEGTLVVDG